jgi:hypothetical protein
MHLFDELVGKSGNPQKRMYTNNGIQDFYVLPSTIVCEHITQFSMVFSQPFRATCSPIFIFCKLKLGFCYREVAHPISQGMWLIPFLERDIRLGDLASARCLAQAMNRWVWEDSYLQQVTTHIAYRDSIANSTPPPPPSHPPIWQLKGF